MINTYMYIKQEVIVSFLNTDLIYGKLNCMWKEKLQLRNLKKKSDHQLFLDWFGQCGHWHPTEWHSNDQSLIRHCLLSLRCTIQNLSSWGEPVNFVLGVLMTEISQMWLWRTLWHRQTSQTDSMHGNHSSTLLQTDWLHIQSEQTLCFVSMPYCQVLCRYVHYSYGVAPCWQTWIFSF
jgi:hypothetical protein